MNSQQVQDVRLMYEAVYNNELREKADEYNSMIRDEDIVEVAAEYFYTYGLNSTGVNILIEKVGLDNFVEFVYDLSEGLILTEAKKTSKAKKQPSMLASQRAKLAAQKAAKERTESERKEPESKGPDTESKAEQPKSKKPIRDAIARQILAGMERHRKGMEIARETGKTLGKLASVTHEAGRRAGEHVKRHGLKSLANEEFDNFDIILEYLVAEGYADTNENALKIMANISEEWKQSIVEARQEERESDKRKRRIRRSRLPHDGGKGKRAEEIRQDWHTSQRGRRGESPLASNPRYENEPGRRIRGQGYVRYSDDD